MGWLSERLYNWPPWVIAKRVRGWWGTAEKAQEKGRKEEERGRGGRKKGRQRGRKCYLNRDQLEIEN